MFKTTHLLAAAALFSASAAGIADSGTLAAPMYLRGGFNGWGLDHPLAYKGNGVYEAEILVSPGYHGFKIGSKDWSAEWVIDPGATVTIAAGTSYRMQARPGPEDYLFVKKTSTWRFTIDASDPAAPLMRAVQTATPPASTADPHQGHAAGSASEYRISDGASATVRYSTPDATATRRSYTQSTTMALRDPGPQSTTYQEAANRPTVRSGSLAFDALFALALDDMKQDAVAQIKDGNYNGAAAIDCDCFETGEKWHYVWTRDLSYAADLGLAMLDSERVRNSLNFKLSGYRPGITRAPQVAGSADGLQIVQDTGSGGSWPVSTDRVAWALGAEAALNTLPPAQRAPFAARALEALVNTLENDRIAAFDSASGLYMGEQSFLDWRDQSYAAWIVTDLASLASSKALSTNVLHYKALTLATSLAHDSGDLARSAKYAGWADALKRSINERLWLEDAGMYSSLTAPHFDGAPLHKFDWLGQALAILTGVADGERARRILASYPHGPMGAPVIYPQQPGMPVYHNRAIWPFVTAYGLKAASLHANVSVADAAYDTLMRGAALNLSNMENLEWISGQPLLLDEQHPGLIGPVINSKRQLWSVGGYLGMVIGNVFGVSVSGSGIKVRPFITAKLRRETFGAASVITLDNLTVRGKRIKVRITLPDATTKTGYYPLKTITVNGAAAAQSIGWEQLPDNATIDVALGSLQQGDQQIRRVDAAPYAEGPDVFGPREPSIAQGTRAATLRIDANVNGAGTVYNVYRDGKLIAAGVGAGDWRDRAAPAAACYAIEAQFSVSGNRSHHSVPRCTGTAIEVAAMVNGVAQPHVKDWGKPGERLRFGAIRIAQAGEYGVQVRYHNGANQINLGISGGVKWLVLKDASGRIAAQDVVQLPHARIDKTGAPPVMSTPLHTRLTPGLYALEMSDFYNMSYLQSNSTFSAAGGAEGPSNKFDVYGARLLRLK
ncbi:MGH1-like glycoside hydrolase domain-containing protein [Massilia antarctica]|uniref:MGH1-like glycoside hydrolase domain-containing protein n=1 Tax=Massilia antarctica TaxID=2765360 RepID=UPI00226F3942|nr:esterase [Massilia sp. H27-R4]MCY0911185.1 esterase [Massilia sp. H27-R4]